MKASDVKKAVIDALKANSAEYPLTAGVSVLKYKSRVRHAEFTVESCEENKRDVWEIWTDAVQEALNECDRVEIPYFEQPLFIDAPMLLKTGNCLSVHPRTRIFLVPDTNTCMVRNKNLFAATPDRNVSVKGGVWSTLTVEDLNIDSATGKYRAKNGNYKGPADKADSLPGGHAVFLFYNADNVTVRDVTVRECAPFGVQIGRCTGFTVQNVTFDKHKRDGVHISAPAENGLIENVSGLTNDDILALNAWDWQGCTVGLGDIKNVYVKNLRHTRGGEMRLLQGKRDGRECSVKNCVFENVRGIKTVKMFAQPNLEAMVDGVTDRSESVGYVENIFFENLICDFPLAANGCLVQLCADAENLCFSDVALCEDEATMLKNGSCLVRVGPKSETYRYDENDQRKWFEVYDPDAVCSARLSMRRISAQGSPCVCRGVLAGEARMRVNRDYPQSTPKGGAGYGKIERLVIVKD